MNVEFAHVPQAIALLEQVAALWAVLWSYD